MTKINSANSLFNAKLLLSDAKLPKYVPEGFVGADFADDFAEVVEGFAEVLGYQVRREGGDMEAGADTLES